LLNATKGRGAGTMVASREAVYAIHHKPFTSQYSWSHLHYDIFTPTKKANGAGALVGCLP
jgi:hypothetical protein